MFRHLLAAMGVLVLVCVWAPSYAGAPQVAGPSEWFVELDGTNGYYAGPGVPEDAVAALEGAQKGNAQLNSFAFTAGGDWFLLSGNGAQASVNGWPAYPKLKEWQDKHVSIRSVAFAPEGGWMAILGAHGFWGPGGKAWDKVKEFVDGRHSVRSIAFGPGGCFVVLYDEAGVSYEGVPSDLARVLDNAAAKNVAVQCVAFTGKDWICLARDQWWTSNANMPASVIVDRGYKHGLHPKWISFVPNLGPFNAAKYEAIIRDAMSGGMAGGYACEAIDHGKVAVSIAEGWSRAPWEPADPSVQWTVDKPDRIASLSKTITAMALLKLWQDSASSAHQFSLDEPFWPYLKDICPDANADIKMITIRQALTHRSGFDKDSDARTPAQLNQFLSQPLANTPGKVSKYQNVNYYIARLLIEKISREDYTAYVKEHVLSPMGITDMETHSEKHKQTCFYGKAGDRISGDEGYDDDATWAGAGGWFATATDLGKFLEGIRQCRVLTPSTTAMMLNDTLGWDRKAPWTKGGVHNSPNGGTNHTAIAYFPDGIAACILINCDVSMTDGGPLLIKAWTEARY